jgi:hypothetical protein
LDVVVFLILAQGIESRKGFAFEFDGAGALEKIDAAAE